MKHWLDQGSDVQARSELQPQTQQCTTSPNGYVDDVANIQHIHTCAHSAKSLCSCQWCANDPSAGSPTETLLRLLLPLSDKVH